MLQTVSGGLIGPSVELYWKVPNSFRGFIFLQSTFLLPLFLLSSFLPLWKPAPVKPSTSYGYYSTLFPLFLSLSHPYFGLFHGLVLLDQPVSEKKQVLNRVSKVMNYLTPKNFWSCHLFCIGRERSIRRLTLTVLITAIWPLKWRFCVAQRHSHLGAGWSLRNQYFNLFTYRTIVHPWPISIFEPRVGSWLMKNRKKLVLLFKSIYSIKSYVPNL